jgi:acyl-CoA synthetase (AMP-forming)/AMP-acid ligase II
MGIGAPTMQQLLERAYGRFGPLPAVRDDSGSLTYAELGSYVRRVRSVFAAWGLSCGDRVALAGANSLDYVLVDLACFASGMVRVGINRRSHPSEVGKLVRQSGARVVFADAEWFAVLSRADVLPADVRIVGLDAPFRGVVENAAELPPGEDLRPDSPAALIFTSGTTGEPKAITVTQGNLAGMVRNLLVEVDIAYGSRVLHPIPLSHAAVNLVLAFACRGADQLVLRDFDPGDVLKRIESDRIEVLTAVPTALAMLAGRQHAAGHEVSSLKAVVYGGSSISRADAHACVAAFGETLYQVYAQSESSLPLTCLNPADHVRAAQADGALLGSAGRPVPFIDLAIVDAERRWCEPGRSGEVVVRGDTVMSGYLDDQQATAEVIDADGWLHTGDVGYLSEDGYLYIVDRLKDMIISGGFNVFPSEIEQVVSRLPGVRDVAVYGVPDDRWGESVCVAVVTDGTDVTLEEIQRTCRVELSSYKIPRVIRTYDSLPLNATGKVLRRLLRDWHDG